MKKIFSIIVLCAVAAISNAQGIAGFFTQSQTRLKDMAQQVACYQLYLGYLNDGYKIVQKGNTTVHDLKNGTFKLHEGHLNSLKSINPAISGSKKIAAIISLNKAIQQDFKKLNNNLAALQFNSDECAYINKVYKNLLQECDKDLSQLDAVTTSGKLEMTDDERIGRIDGLYLNMQDKYTFAESFINNARLLSLQKSQEINNNQTAKKLYGLK